MAELSKRLHFLKNGIEQTAKAYSTIDEAGSNYIKVKIDGKVCYVAIGDVGDVLATKARVIKNGIEYAIKSEAVTLVTVTLRCKDLKNNRVIATIEYNIPAGEVLYFNNNNAPSILNYDFVSMDGIKKIGVSAKDVIDVYYVEQSVPDRNKSSWYGYYQNNISIVNADVINTYTATRMYRMYYQCTALNTIQRMNTSNVTDMGLMFGFCESLTAVPEMDTSKVTNMDRMYFSCKSLTAVPEMDTSNVTNMDRMYSSCKSLTAVPEMDTSNVTSMAYMFAYCDSLTTIPEMNTSKVANMEFMFAGLKLKEITWDIDMRNCTNCNSMFFMSAIENARLKNVSKSLDLSGIGTKKYTVVNYID